MSEERNVAVLMEFLSVYRLSKGVTEEAFARQLARATRHWARSDFYKVGEFIVDSRLSPFMPTVAQILETRKTLEGVEVWRRETTQLVLSKSLPLRAKCEHDREWRACPEVFSFIEERTAAMLEDLVPALLDEAFMLGAKHGARTSGMSPEKIEVLGKYLMAKANEARQEDRYQ